MFFVILTFFFFLAAVTEKRRGKGGGRQTQTGLSDIVESEEHNLHINLGHSWSCWGSVCWCVCVAFCVVWFCSFVSLMKRTQKGPEFFFCSRLPQTNKRRTRRGTEIKEPVMRKTRESEDQRSRKGVKIRRKTEIIKTRRNEDQRNGMCF